MTARRFATVAAVIGAFVVARPAAAQSATQPPTPLKDPAAASIFSILIPGLGQFYTGHVAAGVAHLAAAVGAGVMMTRSDGGSTACQYGCANNHATRIVGAIFYLGNGAISALTAYADAQLYNKAQFRGGQVRYGALADSAIARAQAQREACTQDAAARTGEDMTATVYKEGNCARHECRFARGGLTMTTKEAIAACRAALAAEKPPNR